MALPLSTDPLDVALDTDGDIKIDPQLGLVFVSGIDGIVQLARISMLLFLGEWFMNMDIGIPYYDELLGDASKTPGVRERAEAVFAAAILGVPGVVSINQLTVDIDPSGRSMTVTWSAATLFGDTPTDLLEAPNG